MEDNKMYAQPMYKCAICGSIHESIPARIQCETECYKKQELEAKKAAEAKKKEEQATRKAETDEIVKKAIESVRKYTKDYGHYELENEEDNFDFMWPSRILHYFL